jgi:hypothetical protein
MIGFGTPTPAKETTFAPSMFGFGTTTTATATTTTTTTTAAPLAFGTTTAKTPASLTALPNFATTVTNPSTSLVVSSSDIHPNRLLNDIIKEMEDGVNNNKDNNKIRIFVEQAKKVADWEQQIRECKKDEQELKDRCDKLKIYRNEIDGKCLEIQNSQSILEEELNGLDESLSRIIDQKAESNILDTGDDYDRERTYAMVEELDLHLQHMENNLKIIIKNFNQTRDSNLKDENANNNPLLKIVQILNIHHNNLSWLESKSKKAVNEIKDLSYLL